MIRIFVILPLLLTNLLLGQNAYVDVAVDKSQISTIETFTYQITTDCDCNIEPPDLSEFDVLSRQPGQFSQTFNNNGKVTNQCIASLTYILRPKKKGKFTIGAARSKCQNENKTSESIQVTVVDADELHQANEGKVTFYYKLLTDKATVFVGEPFKVSLLLYSEKLPEDINNIVRGDALGLTRHPLFNERQGHVFRRTKERIKGKDYHVIELIHDVCFADQPGKLQISPYYGSAVEEYGFISSKYMEGYSNSLEINVKKVQGTLPENFYGLAGNFEITHEISETTVKANHALDIWVSISGTGNFHLLKTPEFSFPKDSFLIAEPEVEKTLTTTDEGPTGTAKYHYVITPTQPGTYYVPPYSFAYFDWKTQQIKMASTHEFTLNVLKGNHSNSSGSLDTDIQEAERDIRYIHSQPGKFFSDDDFLYGSLFHVGAVCLSVGSFFVFLMIRRRKSRRSEEEIRADIQTNVKRSAVRDIRKIKRLEGAEGINELKKSLEEYFMANLNVGRSALSKRYIQDALKQKNVEQHIIDELGEIWDKIEMARYSPVSSDNLENLYDRTEQLLTALNKRL